MVFSALVAFVVLLSGCTALVAQRPVTPGKRGGVVAVRPPKATLERWNSMPPDERKRLLDQLPPDRRERLENRMHHFNELSEEEREQLTERFQAFRRMPVERQERARNLFRRFNQLPDERRPLVRSEFDTLRSLSEADRRSRMSTDEFRRKFTTSEQEFLQDLSSVMAPEPDSVTEKSEKTPEKKEP
jgi:hypothetical protein